MAAISIVLRYCVRLPLHVSNVIIYFFEVIHKLWMLSKSCQVVSTINTLPAQEWSPRQRIIVDHVVCHKTPRT